MKQRPNTYWDRRALQRMKEYHRGADSTVYIITAAYDRAVHDINMEIEKIFRTFGADGQLDPKKARKILNQYIPNPLLKLAKIIYPKLKNDRIKRWLLNKMNAPAYRARITRLQALKENVYLQSRLIADVEIEASTKGYVRTMKEAYYRTMFDIQHGLGVGFEFASMPTNVIETILKRPWSGQHFSKRIWNNTDVLAERMTNVITAGFMSGASIDKMVRELEGLSELGKHAASRLVRTETTYMANAAEMESYEEAGIEKYLFMATLDKRTSTQCQQHDKKVYKTKEAVPGVNMPPLHPYCRSTTRAYFGEDTLKGIQRRARDPETGKTYLVPASMNYAEWKKQYAA
ncbi:minor capsid protein [Paenibacillus alvei]|uniref:minor capsid protein n=1 Tax=Paenibacillus alvei TaxID=44250 RepID=UPI0002886D00|nr:minor capsid protein [Paenibacillus alvei]EJW14294.1 phage head morphogenesis protein, SPP1 gp7 family [Paenibacillus alvei DSM 29]MCY9539223.1 minor capsid protein [Paenibacillus alvei]MCY9706731.1 minor capsid protein [Paenibacillus alvei]MCY9737008.1 minor capsid protein [Paenibacillus alvei]MCY9758818.1 minor capsid protein [Paenibacillus alvei]